MLITCGSKNCDECRKKREQYYFEQTFQRAIKTMRPIIERERDAEYIDSSILNFVLR